MEEADGAVHTEVDNNREEVDNPENEEQGRNWALALTSQGSPGPNLNTSNELAVQAEFQAMQSSFSRIVSLAPPYCKSSSFSETVRQFALLLDDYGKSKQVIEEERLCMPSSPDRHGLCAPEVQCALRVCYHPGNEQLPAVYIERVDMLSNTIGTACDTYIPASRLQPQESLEFPKEPKKHICSNKDCATRRLGNLVTSKATEFLLWTKSAPNRILEREWLRLNGPPVMTMSGHEIKNFLSISMVSTKHADACVRLLRSLEQFALLKNPESPGRYYVSPTWAGHVTKGEICLETSYQMFHTPPPPYKVDCCNIVLTMLRHGEEWTAYAFHLENQLISVMDPCGAIEVNENKKEIHKNYCTRMLQHLLYCIRRSAGGTSTFNGNWKMAFLLGGVGDKNSEIVDSGIHALNCLRWCNGLTVCVPPRDADTPESRRDLAYQLLCMATNVAHLKIINESGGEGTIYQRKKPRRGQ